MRRRFSLDDQRAFAALSGDWNPLHVDPIAARRLLFGEPVVHGVHLVLWVLDCLGGPPVGKLTATFRKPCPLDRDVELEVTGDRVVARCAGRVVLELEIERATVVEASAEDRAFAQAAPRNVQRDEIAACQGEVALACDRMAAARLFPSIHSITQLAELLAITRIVGMECPGLHSVFSRLTLVATSGPGVPRYRVEAAVLKFASVKLHVEGPTLAGTLETFYRPVPPELDATGRVSPGAFADQRALVIGGSRGLGEAIARVVAAGGGRVAITYQVGATDAAVVARATGATVLALDVTAPGSLALPWAPTHVYYCATRGLQITRDEPASERDRALDRACHVEGLSWLARVLDEPAVLWAPSTSLLDKPEPGLATYIEAKRAMEQLALAPHRVVMPRLSERVQSVMSAPTDLIGLAITQLAALPVRR